MPRDSVAAQPAIGSSCSWLGVPCRAEQRVFSQIGMVLGFLVQVCIWVLRCMDDGDGGRPDD